MSKSQYSTNPEEVEILALVTARGGSKGVPMKNIREVAGKPLLAYNIETAKKSEYVDRIIVSTDNEEIASVAREYNAEVPFMRPNKYARDRSRDFPVLKHCVEWLQQNENYEPDIIAHLRPTGPLLTADELNASIEKFQRHPEADSLRSVKPASKNPYKMYETEGEYLEPFLDHPEIDEAYNAPRQSLPQILQTASDIGLCRRETIIEMESILGDNILPFKLNRPTIDIDTPTDLKLAEVMIKEQTD